jgi:hypothetical protein
MQHAEAKSIQDEDEISSEEIIRFFRRNAKSIGLITLGLSVIAIALSFLTPKQYQKQLTLLVKSTPISLSVQPLSAQSFPSIDVTQTSALAAQLLNSIQIDQVTAQAQADIQTPQINIYLQSANTTALNLASAQILSQLKAKFQAPVSQTLETSLTATELQLKKQKQILPELEQRIAQLPSTDTAKLQALETKRAESVAAIAALEFDKDYLEQSQKNLANFTAKVVSVQIVKESNLQPISSLKQVVIVALITSFIAAVVTVIIREQIARWLKDKRSEQKIHGTTDV